MDMNEQINVAKFLMVDAKERTLKAANLINECFWPLLTGEQVDLKQFAGKLEKASQELEEVLGTLLDYVGEEE